MREKTRITDKMIADRNYYLGAISKLTGVPADDIMSKSRVDRISTARMLLMWVLVTQCHYTTTAVGLLLHRHHSTIIHGASLINGRMFLPQEIEDCKAYLRKMQLIREGGAL